MQHYFQGAAGTTPRCGECWSLSTLPGSVSDVLRGRHAGESLVSLISRYQEQLMGAHVYEKYGDTCPLLVKFIDAKDALSVQVHPDNELAERRHSCLGKTEMWYILEAEANASIATGFRAPMTPKHYERALFEGNLLETLRYEVAKPEDAFVIPAGRIHSIGKGVFFAEIQQASDITYRIHDFDREDAFGKTRDLHVPESMEALDFSVSPSAKQTYVPQTNVIVPMATTDYFVVNRLHCRGGTIRRNMQEMDSFVIYLCTFGQVQWGNESTYLSLQAGDCILVPAVLSSYYLQSTKEGALLEAYVPKSHLIT